MAAGSVRACGPLVVVALTAACATALPSPGDLPAREVTGHFTMGESSSWFRPCGGTAGDTLWWATFMGRAVAQRDSLAAAGSIQAGTPAFLRVRAGLSDPQPAGADGRGSRFIYVRDVLEVRLARAGDCGS